MCYLGSIKNVVAPHNITTQLFDYVLVGSSIMNIVILWLWDSPFVGSTQTMYYDISGR